MKHFIDFRGQRLFCQVTGTGPAIVLLHGFLESHEMWKNYARKLSDSFRVVAIDLPGHGQSGLPSGHHSIEMMADAVRQVLTGLNIDHCLMVGHSMGGYVAMAFAEKYPRKLKGLVMFHSHAGADSPEARVNRDRTISVVQKDRYTFIKNFIPGHFDPDNMKKFQADIAVLEEIAGNTSRDSIIASLEAMKNRPDRQHVLVQSKVPVLFIIGKNDSRVPMQVVLPQVTLPGHSELLLLDHVGHMGFIEAPLKTFAAVRGFAERIYKL